MDSSLVFSIVLTTLTSVVLFKLGYLTAKLHSIEKRLRRLEKKIDQLNNH